MSSVYQSAALPLTPEQPTLRRRPGDTPAIAAPALRAQLENGDVYDDPSEDALFEILGDIEARGALWVIVERVDDPTRQTYAQALRDKDGSHVVERRLGAPATHQTAQAADMRAAHQLLTAWAFAL